MRQYYLLSLKWSNGDYYTWWGPDNCGYTRDIAKAGIYSEETINAQKSYYSNTSTMPVPVEVVDNSLKQELVVARNENYSAFGIKEHLKNAKEY